MFRTVFLVYQVTSCHPHLRCPSPFLYWILAVPGKQPFYNGRILPSSPAFFRYRWNILLAVPRASMMIGTSTTSFQFQRRFSCVFKCWYFLLLLLFYYFLFFKTYLMVKWASNIYYCAVPFLAVYNYDVWSHSNLHSSDSSTGFGSWSYYQFRKQPKLNFWHSLQ